MGPEIEKKALYLGAGSIEADSRHGREALETQLLLAESWSFLRVLDREARKRRATAALHYAGELKSASVGFDSPAFFWCIVLKHVFKNNTYSFAGDFEGQLQSKGV